MDKFKNRGYVVRETGPVYYTKDMDKTSKWFEDVLGWYSEIDERDENNNGLYGCVYDTPPEFENLHLAPFTGIHMFYGESDKRMVAFMKVSGIEKLRDYVIEHKWNDITKVTIEPWGGKTCTLTTIDGTVLHFFE